MSPASLLNDFRGRLPRPSAMQIGIARSDLLRAIAREDGDTAIQPPVAPFPRLTIAALAIALVAVVLVLALLLGALPGPR
jgi:hypothetical protein